MKHILAFACFFLAPAAVLAIEAPSDTTQFNVICPAQRLLPELDAAFHECGHELGGNSCGTFVAVFKQLLPEFDCQRSFDHTPSKDYVVPAVWLAGAAHDDFVTLLSTLKLPAARCLFGSAAFRATLDGDLAEDYLDNSRRVEQTLGSSCNGL